MNARDHEKATRPTLALLAILLLAALLFAIALSALAGIPRATGAERVAAARPSAPPFPRLGMWWMEPEKVSAKKIARYDLVLNEFEGPELVAKLKAVRAINPRIEVFRPISPSERSVFWDDEEGVPNPEINDLPTSHFLLFVGSSLSEPISATQTRIHVENLTYPNGLPIFLVGRDVAIGEGESAHIKGINASKKELLVQRGYGRPAAAHETGTSVTPHVRFWPGTWVMNVAAACPRVQVPHMSAPVNWIDYFFNLTVGATGGLFTDQDSNPNFIDQKHNAYDGIVIDRFEDIESWLMWVEDEDEARPLDLTHTGVATSRAAFDASWRAGTDQLLALLREKYPGVKIIRNNPISTRYTPYDGQVFETGGWSKPSVSWWRRLFVKTDEGDYEAESCYLDWFKKKKDPRVLLEVYEVEDPFAGGDEEEPHNPFLDPGFVPNYKRMRFSLTSALLGDGYYSYEISTAGHGSLGLMWFDEYDNAGRGKGYLGYPEGPCKRLPSGAYTRRFTRGLVLVNPQNKRVKVPLNRTYRHIKGKQVPRVNTGKNTRAVTIDAFDGVILLKT